MIFFKYVGKYIFRKKCMGCIRIRLLKLGSTQSILNCKTFDFFDTKFDHSSYSKIYAKHHFFCHGLGVFG